ncbi:MAG: bifunctional homocysteine S-methyltransferase/methylenetetrahydrofolate reductase, partial [Rhizobacter sp.]|nr:bifunctional homocysteine S-methyltransferase/methylenetetrahydrofolate reductase [Chlorobiales bacterium]
MISFIERLKTGKPVVGDGAMGTVLEARGYYQVPCDYFNLTAPQAVEDLHLEYIEAGAELIQTNTYSATPIKLSNFNLSDKADAINREGVRLVKQAIARSGRECYVAGSVGPVGKLLAPVGKIFPEEAYDAFVRQITVLVDAGAQVLVLETFLDLRELDLAIAAAKKVAPEIPIIAEKTFSEDGSILAGTFPIEVMEHLREQGVAVIGSNCTVGPQRMYTIIKQAHQNGDVFLSAMPTAGIPTISNGRQVYNATPEYLATYARQLVEVGVTVIGACCGATPSHIKAIAETVKNMTVGKPAPRPEVKVKTSGEEKERNVFRTVAPEKISNLRRKMLVDKKFVTTVELDIPRGLDISSVIEGATYLKEQGVDAVNITDGARARLRMDSISISKITEDLTGMETIMHYTCRDRNMIALQSQLLGAYALGLRNILVVTGDPAKIGDYPQATSVYDLDSPNLIRAAASLNRGVDLMKNPLGDSTDFFITCGANPLA